MISPALSTTSGLSLLLNPGSFAGTTSAMPFENAVVTLTYCRISLDIQDCILKGDFAIAIDRVGNLGLHE